MHIKCLKELIYCQGRSVHGCKLYCIILHVFPSSCFAFALFNVFNLLTLIDLLQLCLVSHHFALVNV